MEDDEDADEGGWLWDAATGTRSIAVPFIVRGVIVTGAQAPLD